MRLFRTLAVTGLVAVAGAACADLEVTNLNAPDRARALSTANDVEALISGSFQSWWAVVHYSYPSSAMSTAADAHSSSWGNWGMRDAGWEPRRPFDNTPSYAYNNVAETAWQSLYGSLAAISDGLKSINEGVVDLGPNTDRAIFFGKLVQGLSHAYIGLIYDKGFVLDENTDAGALDASTFSTPTEVFNAGMQKLAEAEAIAQAGGFTEIPGTWVGDGASWTPDYALAFIRGYRARLMSQMARNPAERDALDWGQIESDAEYAASFLEVAPYGGEYTGENWSWMRQKLHTAGIQGWARIDNRTIGPGDVTGAYAAWLGTANVEERVAFDMYSPDTRINGQTDTDGDGELSDEDGSLIRYLGTSPFPASRGLYHYSNYIYSGWEYLSTAPNYAGFYPDLTADEMEYLIAEAKLRPGAQNDPAGAMAIINDSRANGNLPPFTDPNGVAPGGADCVPQPDGATCGSLLEALKHEKRIDLFHYGLGTEWFDDRGWGDLVTGTWQELPVPGSELELLLEEIYTFGGVGQPGGAPSIINDISPEGLKAKREAIERYREATMEEIEPGIAN